MMKTAAEAQAIAGVIRSQITPGVLMSLGAHRFFSQTDDRGNSGLVFSARVLPFTINGDRAEQPRIMQVLVTLNAADTYDVTAQYRRGNQTVEHFAARGLYAESLPTVLLEMDSDNHLSQASTFHENRTI